MINALDGNAFWNAESIESLIFNSYVGGACVVELTEKHCEIIRANEKFQKELNTKHSVHELLKIDLFLLCQMRKSTGSKTKCTTASRRARKCVEK